MKEGAKIIDIVVAKKGGSGKTLLSLYKLDVAFSCGLNVLALDLNDMNPDFSEILTNIMEAYGEVSPLPESLKIEEVSDERLLTGDLSIQEYTFKSGQKLGIIRPRFKHRISSLDMQKALYDVASTLLCPGKYEIVIVDTNTNYETLTPWYADKNEIVDYSRCMPSIISSCLVKKSRVSHGYNEGLKDLRKGYIELGGYAAIIISYILPLASLISKDTIRNELLRIKFAIENYWNRIINVIPSLIINAYVPAIGIPLVDKLKIYGRRIKGFINRLTKRKAKRDFNYVIYSLNRLLDSMIPHVKNFRSTNTSRVVSRLKDNLYNVFSGLLRDEYKWKEKITNFFIIPIYDQEFSHIFACLMDYKQIVELLKDKKLTGRIISDVLIATGISEALGESETPIAAYIGSEDLVTVYGFLEEYRRRYEALLKKLDSFISIPELLAEALSRGEEELEIATIIINKKVIDMQKIKQMMEKLGIPNMHPQEAISIAIFAEINNIPIEKLKQGMEITTLQNKKTTTKINLSSMGLEKIDLGLMRACKNLQVLDLSNNSLSEIDLNPLSECKDIRDLYLFSNSLSSVNLSPLRECKKLRTLDIHNNPLSSIDLGPLKKHKGLIITVDPTVRLKNAKIKLVKKYDDYLEYEII